VNEVKDICDAALDAPAPPLREAATALAIARRSNLRRNTLAGAAAALGVAAVALVAAAPKLLVSPAPSRGVEAASSAPTAASPAVPVWPQAQADGHAAAAALIAAVPAGYTAAAEWDSTDPVFVWLYAGDHPSPSPTSQYISITNVVVSKAGHEGLLASIMRRDNVPAPTGDLCSAEVTSRVASTLAGATQNCQVIDVNGVSVRVSSGHEPDLGDVVTAVRFLDGGYLAVQASEGNWDLSSVGRNLPPDAVNALPAVHDHAPALTAPFMTSSQVAALAAVLP
jgi:hypothetical protein